MRTTLNIDEQTLAQIMKHTDTTNRSEAVRRALAAYIRQQEKQQVRAMRGTLDIEDNWRELRAMDRKSL